METSEDRGLIIVPSVHEEVDATIFAICATGTSSKDSLLSWIRCLQKTNPILGKLSIVFMFKNIIRESLYIETGEQNKKQEESFSSSNSVGEEPRLQQ